MQKLKETIVDAYDIYNLSPCFRWYPKRIFEILNPVRHYVTLDMIMNMEHLRRNDRTWLLAAYMTPDQIKYIVNILGCCAGCAGWRVGKAKRATHSDGDASA